jgi:SAM-dependent methyltransferase
MPLHDFLVMGRAWCPVWFDPGAVCCSSGFRNCGGRYGRRMPNADQIEYWDGPAGELWVAEQDRYDRVNIQFGECIVTALNAELGERVLDVGCGNGALCLDIAPIVAPGGTVHGLDISGPMLAAAARRADPAGLDNVTFEKGDAQVHPLPDAAFDAVVSRFGVMFFEDPGVAFANLARTLCPGGRIVFTCWQGFARNEWLMVPVGAVLAFVPMPDLGPPGRPGPFSLSDPERIRAVLAAFTDITVEEVIAPMRLGDTTDDVVEFMKRTDMAQTLMNDVGDDTASAAWAAVSDALGPYASPDGVTLNGAAWLVRAWRPG